MTGDKPLQGRRILVLEDDYYLATDTSGWLQCAGAEVIGPTGSASEACDLIDHARVDGAVLDVNLGHGPNFEVAQQLKEKGVPIIFATGYDQSVLPDELASMPRLEKPFGGVELVEALSRLTRN